MKEEILSIASDLRDSRITSYEAKKLLLVLFGVSDSLGFDKGYKQGYSDATREACQEIAKNYQPNDR